MSRCSAPSSLFLRSRLPGVEKPGPRTLMENRWRGRGCCLFPPPPPHKHCERCSLNPRLGKGAGGPIDATRAHPGLNPSPLPWLLPSSLGHSSPWLFPLRPSQESVCYVHSGTGGAPLRIPVTCWPDAGPCGSPDPAPHLSHSLAPPFRRPGPAGPGRCLVPGNRAAEQQLCQKGSLAQENWVSWPL